MVETNSNHVPFESLESLMRRVLTKDVKEEFSDIEGEEVNANVTRSALRNACLPQDKDSGIMLLMRLFFFYFQLGKISELSEPVYGIPTGTYQELFKFKPHVCLYFKEDLEDVDPDYQPLRTQISYRIMDDTETSITQARLESLARKVKSTFGSNFGYTFKRGKTMATYTDKENGYQLKLFVRNETEARSIIGKVLALENKTIESSKLSISENQNESEAYPTIPPLKNILGENLRMPRKRPIGTVRFTRATCVLWGKTKPIILYDRTGLNRNGLVK